MNSVALLLAGSLLAVPRMRRARCRRAWKRARNSHIFAKYTQESGDSQVTRFYDVYVLILDVRPGRDSGCFHDRATARSATGVEGRPDRPTRDRAASIPWGA